jgi:hypothetical protein
LKRLARLRPWLAAAGLALAYPSVTLAQCPMCRTALETPEAVALARGFNRGILFLLAVPFAAVAVIAVLIVKERRSADEPVGGPAVGA